MSGGLDSSVTAWLLAREAASRWSASRCCSGTTRGGSASAQRPLLRRARPRRRAARRPAGRHPALHAAHGRGLPPTRWSIRSSTTTSPAARPSPACAATPSSSSTSCWSRRARARRRAHGDRPLRAHRRRARTGPSSTARADPAKDQSYYLFELTREQLAACLLPARRADQARGARARPRGRAGGGGEGREHGDLLRLRRGARVRRGARRRAHRPRRARGAPRAGARWSTPAARSSARAEPYYRYTVGQRRGLGIAAGERRLRAARAAGARTASWSAGKSELLAPGLRGERLHWIGRRTAGTSVEATVKIRSRHAGVPAQIRPHAEAAEVEIDFAEPAARRRAGAGRGLLRREPRPRRLLDRGTAVGTNLNPKSIRHRI